ncbi:hypothetical protein H8J86_16285 [Clostridium perfringens]|uniref:hypothetical protein n=1 Tax=Clostridium perfringens TaxID=1502 RepID=UPI00115B1186|nr:hypothetical protein [Clostridium perfringens]ELC8349203.1 hypothetical protein [Clostridium perfringens]MBI6007488.1 hypothetical protein [Clostridium perfringens]MBI6089084.1 hypothetical protein [Clostridium perfringens]MBI6094532.1 hypothetical protein [Clostridium perfringens]MDK0530739.1 hypothetical protein [Clostridium perfringens]
MKRRTIQFRITEDEYIKIKKEFGDINLSNFLREYLLNLVDGKTNDEINKEKLIELLSEDEIINFIYKKLKERIDGKES